MKKVLDFAKGLAIPVLVAAAPFMAYAQIQGPSAPTQGNVPQSNINSLQTVLNTVCIVFSWMFYFLIALAVVFIVVAAFRYLTAGGEAEKVKGAGQTLLYAAIAVGVALLARAIPLIVASFLGAGTLSTC
jgi:hypothetical protein